MCRGTMLDLPVGNGDSSSNMSIFNPRYSVINQFSSSGSKLAELIRLLSRFTGVYQQSDSAVTDCKWDIKVGTAHPAVKLARKL